jgi:AcrR family transcriptional regulator
VAVSRSIRKQLEIAQREEQILDVAREMFLERGYSGLNMDEIAQRINCAKGTVYGHFRNKEDILMEIAARGVDKRAEMFSRAASFSGRSRERMAVLGLACELFFQVYPHYFDAEVLLRTDTLREKASVKRLEFLRNCEVRCMHIVSGIVRDAVAQRELTLPEGTAAEEIAFSLWSLTYGAYNILETGTPLASLGVKEPLLAIRASAHRMLDGLGWTPLASEWDYPASVEHAAREIFPDEVRQLRPA